LVFLLFPTTLKRIFRQENNVNGFGMINRVSPGIAFNCRFPDPVHQPALIQVSLSDEGIWKTQQY
jgi:hypothetical protein